MPTAEIFQPQMGHLQVRERVEHVLSSTLEKPQCIQILRGGFFSKVSTPTIQCIKLDMKTDAAQEDAPILRQSNTFSLILPLPTTLPQVGGSTTKVVYLSTRKYLQVGYIIDKSP